MRKPLAGAVIGLLAWTISASLAEARITQIEILKSEPAYSDAAFGDVGRYEHLVGRVAGELDPADPTNAIIQDINLAPRNARGMVEYTTEIELLKPEDIARGNRILLFEVNNRGNKLAPGNFNEGVGGTFAERNGLTSPGDGWLHAPGLHDGLVRMGNGRAAGHEPRPHAAHRRAQSRRLADHRRGAFGNHCAGAGREPADQYEPADSKLSPRQLRQLSHREPRQSDSRRGRLSADPDGQGARAGSARADREQRMEFRRLRAGQAGDAR